MSLSKPTDLDIFAQIRALPTPTLARCTNEPLDAARDELKASNMERQTNNAAMDPSLHCLDAAPGPLAGAYASAYTALGLDKEYTFRAAHGKFELVAKESTGSLKAAIWRAMTQLAPEDKPTSIWVRGPSSREHPDDAHAVAALFGVGFEIHTAMGGRVTWILDLVDSEYWTGPGPAVTIPAPPSCVQAFQVVLFDPATRSFVRMLEPAFDAQTKQVKMRLDLPGGCAHLGVPLLEAPKYAMQKETGLPADELIYIGTVKQTYSTKNGLFGEDTVFSLHLYSRTRQASQAGRPELTAGAHRPAAQLEWVGEAEFIEWLATKEDKRTADGVACETQEMVQWLDRIADGPEEEQYAPYAILRLHADPAKPGKVVLC
jgi:hypothetical protein